MKTPRWARPGNRSTSAEEERILKELARRERLKPDESSLPDLLGSAFPAQRAFIEDESQYKAAICARRSGKSFGLGLLIALVGLQNPGCTMHYVNKDRGMATKTMFKDIINPINDRFALGLEVRQHPARVVFPNGSVCYLVGADVNEQERDKLRGVKNKLVVIDEVQSYRIDVKDLVESVISPSLDDERGSLVMVGTPGEATTSFWHDVVHGIEPGWSVHRWQRFDNPHMVQQNAERMKWFEANNPAFLKTNRYKREWLGEWVTDIDERCYVHGEQNLDVEVLPPGELIYMMGVDLGYNDAFACVVIAYGFHERTLYVLDAFQQSKLLTHQQVEIINGFRRTYPLSKIVVDGANKQVVQDMKQRHNLPLSTPTSKLSKADHIKMLNSDLSMGTIKLLPKAAEKVIPEWEQLVWDRRILKEQGIFREARSKANHISDAFLYIWRESKNYLAAPSFKPSQKTVSEQVEEEFQRVVARSRMQDDDDWFEPDGGDEW